MNDISVPEDKEKVVEKAKEVLTENKEAILNYGRQLAQTKGYKDFTTRFLWDIIYGLNLIGSTELDTKNLTDDRIQTLFKKVVMSMGIPIHEKEYLQQETKLSKVLKKFNRE